MLPRVYSPETVKMYLKRIKQAQRYELNLNSILDQGSRALISTFTDSLCCSTELILFPLLTAVAGCMGADATVVVDKAKGWTEKPVLWICVAGRRGDKKSPALSRIKQAVAGLEKEMWALHKAQNINSDKEISNFPRLLIDEENLMTVNETLIKVHPPGNRISLIGIFDNFGTFLRGIDVTSKCPLFSPENLLKLYSPCDATDKNENNKSVHHLFHFNFIGTINAIDATGLLDVFDADGLSDRLLVTCPKDPGIIQTADGDRDGNSHTTGTSPTLQTILSGIKNYHQVQKVSYTFREDGRKEFNSRLAELDMWQQRHANDERRRGTIAKAPGQLARLSAVITALNNGIEMSSNGGTSQVLPSSLMTGDVVRSAYQILMYLTEQKMALLPDTEVLVEESDWEDYRVEMNDSFIDSHRVFSVPATGRQAEEDSDKIKLPNDNFPCSRQPLISKQRLGITQGRNPQSSTSKAKMRNNTAPVSVECDGGSTAYFGSKRPHVSRANEEVASKKTCPENEFSVKVDDTQCPIEAKSVSLEEFCNQSSPDDVMVLTENNEIASVPYTRKNRETIPSDRKIMIYTNGKEMDETSRSSESETRSVVDEIPSGSSVHNQDIIRRESQNQNFPMYGQITSDSSMDHSLMLNSGFQIKTPAKDISELTDDELVDYCARKMRKLLLLPGMVVGAATICQKRLFPPVPKEMRLEHPRTTHPVWAAIEYLKRVVKLDLGELVHPVYRFQSIYFRKIRLEYMTQRARMYLKKLFVSDEEYEQSYPKFDDSYSSSFVLIEDDITTNKTPGKCLTYVYNTSEQT